MSSNNTLKIVNLINSLKESKYEEYIDCKELIESYTLVNSILENNLCSIDELPSSIKNEYILFLAIGDIKELLSIINLAKHELIEYEQINEEWNEQNIYS